MNGSTPAGGSATVRWATLIVALALLGNAGAAPDTRFAPAVQVQGTPLVLNGAGSRYKAIFKVYDAALYLPRKVRSADEAFALPGPKRLQFVARRDLPSADIGRLFVKGMVDNSPAQAAEMQAVAIARLIEIFSSRTKLPAGQDFAMEYVPGKGTTFEIGGKAEGTPVGDAEFFEMVMKIWLGTSPADPLLKDALLGAPVSQGEPR